MRLAGGGSERKGWRIWSATGEEGSSSCSRRIVLFFFFFWLFLSFVWPSFLVARDRRLAPFALERRFSCLCDPPFLSPFLSRPLFSFSTAIVPWADLSFRFSDRQSFTGAYPCGSKIRSSCSLDLWSYAWKVGLYIYIITMLFFSFFCPSSVSLLSWIRASFDLSFSFPFYFESGWVVLDVAGRWSFDVDPTHPYFGRDVNSEDSYPLRLA